VNNRFPSIVILGLVVVVLATVINKWVFMGIVMLGGVALAYVVWKLVDRDMFTPPTVLLDEVRAKFTGEEIPAVQPRPAPDEKEPDGIHRTRSDEQ
jgi:hypothetical protein